MLNEKIKTLIFVSNIWVFGVSLLGPLFAVYSQKIGGDIFDITSAWAAYLFVSGLAVIVVGKLSDNVSKTKLLIAGYVIGAVSTLGYIFVENPVQLIFLQAWLGLSDALISPTWDSLYSQYGSRKKSGLEWGLADGLPSIVQGCAVILGGVIVSYFSFKPLFITMALIQLIAAGYTLNMLRYEKNKAKRK